MSRQFTVVLDIDETIAYGFSEHCLEKIKLEYPITIEFEKCGLLVWGYLWHIIFPGVIELIRLLDSRDIQIAFYSAGRKSRNEILIATLLKIALGEVRFQAIRPAVKILSRDDLVSLHPAIPDFQCKDLKKVLPSGKTDVCDIAIIEDNRNYLHPEQIKNGLLVLGAVQSDFFDVHEFGCDDPYIYSRVNQIFYATGLLFSAMDDARRRNIALSDALHFIQYSYCAIRRTHILNDDARTICQGNKLTAYFYLYGLKLLCAFNSNLRMIEAQMLFPEEYVSHDFGINYILDPALKKACDDQIDFFLEEASSRKKIQSGECEFFRKFVLEKNEVIRIDAEKKLQFTFFDLQNLPDESSQKQNVVRLRDAQDLKKKYRSKCFS